MTTVPHRDGAWLVLAARASPCAAPAVASSAPEPRAVLISGRNYFISESEHRAVSITPDRSALTDATRLAAVHRYEILDAPIDGQFDTIAAAAAAVCGTPIATVSIVDADRVWFAAARGLHGVAQVGTEPGLCASAFCTDGPYVVTDAVTDPRTLDHPLVRGELGLRFYAAAPIVTTDGHHLGTVTAIDAIPRELTESQSAVLGHLADLVAQHLELRLATLTAVRTERQLHDEAEQRAAAAAELADQMRAAAGAHAALPHPERCQLGAGGCTAPAELKIADSWGDSAWGCPTHVGEAIINVRSVFIANEELGGLASLSAPLNPRSARRSSTQVSGLPCVPTPSARAADM